MAITAHVSGLDAELGGHPRDDPLDLAGDAEHHPGLQRLDGVLARSPTRGRSSSTLRSWAPRRPSASSEISMPGAIAPPTYWPSSLDHVERRGGAAEVDDDRRAAVDRGGGQRVDDPVGADLARVVHQDGHAGAHAGLDHHVRNVGEVPGEHVAPLVQHRRHGRADRDPVDLRRSPRRAGRGSAPPTRRRCGCSSVATRQSASDLAVGDQPEHGVALPMSAASRVIVSPRADPCRCRRPAPSGSARRPR